MSNKKTFHAKAQRPQGSQRNQIMFFFAPFCSPLRLCAKFFLLFLLATQGAYAQGDLLRQVQDSNRKAAQVNQQREARFAQARDQQAARLQEAQAELHRH